MKVSFEFFVHICKRVFHYSDAHAEKPKYIMEIIKVQKREV